VALLYAVAFTIDAQPPAIGQNGVMNTASRIPPTLPGGPIARGTLFTIAGVRLGTVSTTTVAILHGDTREAVAVLAVQPKQIEARMPLSAPLGKGSLEVETAGQASKTFPIDIVASNPGLFSRNGEGWGPGRVDNLSAQGRPTPNTFDEPAIRGQRIRVMSTGLGGIAQIHVVIGNRSIAARSVQPGSRPGEEEIVLRIPETAPVGCYVPLYLEIPGSRASNVVTVAIAARSESCDSGPVRLLRDNRAAGVVLSRIKMRAVKSNLDIVEDHAAASFANANNFGKLSPFLLLPPAGTCTAYTGSLQADPSLLISISDALVSDLESVGLDAGPQLTLAQNGQSRWIPSIPGAPGLYKSRLGSDDPSLARHTFPLFLNGGDFVLSGEGGKNVGAFQFTLQGPAPLEWTDRAEHAIIDRKLPLTIHWTAEPTSRMVVILATNVDRSTTAIGACLCVAQARAGHTTVPAALLANIPKSEDIPGIPYDQLFVAVLPPKTTPITVPGLKGGSAISIYAEGRFALYR
jgi:uncharacterized protein (TIGR03437 family)